jgi:2'-5' RNA ligase
MKRIAVLRVWMSFVAATAFLAGPAFGAQTEQMGNPAQRPSGEQKAQDFSVWLVPAHDKQNYLPLQRCIEDLARRSGIRETDIFVPHVTIYWGKSSDPSLAAVAKRTRKIALENGPVTLTVAGLGVTRDRFKSLFLTFAKEPRLYKWSEQIGGADKVERTDYTLMPHLSLFYPKQGTEMPFDGKIVLLNYVMREYAEPLKWFKENESPNREFAGGFRIVFDRIQLRREDEEDVVSSWVLVNEYPLGGGAR